ncbi:MAG: PASTA domain-containing protein [Acidimicrobiales bacterium]
MKAPRQMKLLGITSGVVLALGCGACSTSRQATGRSTSTTASTTTTTAPQTTTTLPPTTTTTVPTAVVPDAAAAGQQCGCESQPILMLRQAGFVYQNVLNASSGACYYTDPLNGQRAWNSGEVIGQEPNPGTVAPVGSTVDLIVCSGTASIVP